MTKLNVNQEKFCNEYAKDGNASKAYRCAYLCKGWKDNSVWVAASKLLATTKVSLRVEELRRGNAERSEITRDMVLAEYKKIAFSSIAHMHNSWVDRKAFEELTPNEKACIESIDTKVVRKLIKNGEDSEPVEVEQIKIKLYSKLVALDKITEMQGWKEPTKHEVTGKSGESLFKGFSKAELINLISDE